MELLLQLRADVRVKNKDGPETQAGCVSGPFGCVAQVWHRFRVVDTLGDLR